MKRATVKRPTADDYAQLVRSVYPKPSLADGGETFVAWFDTFRASVAGLTALATLSSVANLRRADELPSFGGLAFLCLRACYFAAHFDPECDPGVQYRKRVAGERQRLGATADAVANLRALLAKSPRATMWALPTDEFRLWRKGGLEKQNPAHNLLRFLLFFERNLRGRLPEIHGGPWLHRFTFACLHYDTSKEGTRTPTVAAALLFHLVLLFRLWTSRGEVTTQSGMRIPVDRSGRAAGRPCYNVAVELVNASLCASMDERTARTLVESLRNAKVGIWPWPNEARDPPLKNNKTRAGI